MMTLKNLKLLFRTRRNSLATVPDTMRVGSTVVM